MSSLATEPARRQRDTKRDAFELAPAADGHTHCAVVDWEGNGITGAAPDGHWHRVRELEVLSSRGHVHELAEKRCGARHNAAGNHIVKRP